jgi:ferrochelatase
MMQSPMSDDRVGVLLFNLGGPETLEDVRPFLYNLFSDPEIIRIKSTLLRKLLAWTISWTRQGKSKQLYRQIGGGSPLRKITEDQAAALKVLLQSKGTDARVYVGMRCWKPTIDEAVEQIIRDDIRRLVLIPLFPQYSMTTTGSCFRYFRSLDKQLDLSSKIKIFYRDDWFEEPVYVDAMADQIEAGLRQFREEERLSVHLLYSAHSIPARYIIEGDPYLEQTRKCVSLINSRLGNRNDSSLAFQSKVGPVQWLGPDTKDVLAELAKNGAKRILVIPISFVSDHIETLQEIDILYRGLATELGISEFRRAPALNLSPGFIEALAAITLKSLNG